MKNPKPEIRMAKEIRIPNCPSRGWLFSDFEFRASFGFRISEFGFEVHRAILKKSF